MTLEQIFAWLPNYAKDLKLNLVSVLNQAELSPTQAWGSAVASALAARNSTLYRAIVMEACKHISQEALESAKAAGAITDMNNIFYRFQRLTENERYNNIPTRLRMNVLRTHGTDPKDFELWCIAVSAVNGSSKCISAHEKALLATGATEETIAACIRIASVIYATAAVLDAEVIN
jgi:alkyl hydroperoxide reductase subunit D